MVTGSLQTRKGGLLVTRAGGLATSSACCRCGAVPCLHPTALCAAAPTSYSATPTGITFPGGVSDDLGYNYGWLYASDGFLTPFCVVDAGNAGDDYGGTAEGPSFLSRLYDGSVPSPGFRGESHTLGLWLYRSSATHVKAMIGHGGGSGGGGAFKPLAVSFKGEADTTCGARRIRLYNAITAGGGSVAVYPEHPAYGANPLGSVVGYGGYLDLVACCPACGCPAGLPSAVALDGSMTVDGTTTAFTATLDRAGLDDEGNDPCSYSGTDSIGYGWDLVYGGNPCGWRISTNLGGAFRPRQSPDPTGTYTLYETDGTTITFPGGVTIS